MMPRLTIEVKEARSRFDELMAQVAEGAEIILTIGERPFARILPIPLSNSKRIAGLHPGAFVVGDDFDEPLTDEFWFGHPSILDQDTQPLGSDVSGNDPSKSHTNTP